MRGRFGELIEGRLRPVVACAGVRWGRVAGLLVVLAVSCCKEGRRSAPEEASGASVEASVATNGAAGADAAAPAGSLVLHHVASAQGALRAHVLGRGVVLEEGSGVVAQVTTERIATIPRWFEGVLPHDTPTEVRLLHRVVGSWPDSLWLVTRCGANSKFLGEVWHRTGQKWSRIAETPWHWEYGDATPYRGGLLTAVQDSRGTDTTARRRRVLERLELVGAKGRTPQLDPPTAACPVALQMLDLVTLENDDVFAAGELCASLGGGLAVERWRPSSPEGKIERLHAPVGAAEAAPRLATFAAMSATELWAAGRADGAPWLEHFDGNAWAREEAPGDLQAITFAATAPDGARWIVDRPAGLAPKATLWHKRPGASWEKFELTGALAGPDSSLEIVDAWAFEGDDLWLMAYIGGGKGTWLFRNRWADHVEFLRRQ